MTTVVFEDRELTLRPADASHRRSLELEFDSLLSWDDAHSLLRRYLSVLCWSQGSPVREVFFLAGGQRVGFGNRPLAHHMTEHFLGIPTEPPDEQRALLAVSLYREALGVNSLPYQILGFFKIINIVHDNADSQQKWIASALPHLSGREVVDRIEALQRLHADVPRYLYGSCRCAVAHAYTKPIADPDLVSDDNRLRSDLPLIRALAERLMQMDLRISR